MSGTSTPSTASMVSKENRQRWADLDKENERLVDATHPLLADLRRDYQASTQPAGVA